ncbi:MAG: hypothetical protein ACI8YQ_005049 [Polaribacter sp.]|jgi:hypothetical protein
MVDIRQGRVPKIPRHHLCRFKRELLIRTHKITIMKKLFVLAFCLAIVSVLPAQSWKGALNKAKDTVKDATGGQGVTLSQEEIGNGLKEALDKGVDKAVKSLSAEDGYLKSPYKILLPKEAQTVVNKVKRVPGFQDADKKLTAKLNKAAEIAAKEATPIFIGAIKQMSFKDAMNILMGEKNSATTYLDKSTRKTLFGKFMPVIQKSLDEVNAREYWNSIVSAYNKIPLTKKVNPNLDEHVNNKALDGMFGLIAVKELDIRDNQSSRSSDLLKKVFGKQDKK